MRVADCADRFWVEDDFLGTRVAEGLRSAFVRHAGSPEVHGSDTHQVWNYWHVPGAYTYLRTAPEKILPPDLLGFLYASLKSIAAQRFGMLEVSWPFLSLYVPGCRQVLHNDSRNGRFGYVYSLTPDERKTQGGETMILKDGNLYAQNLERPASGSDLVDLVEPRFNRLTVFDDRVPHGVEMIRGSMDPVEGRLVLHGHLAARGAKIDGPIEASELNRFIADHEALVSASGRKGANGPLVLRFSISKAGAVQDLKVLIDRVAFPSGGSTNALVAELIRLLLEYRFPQAGTPTSVILPILFGTGLSQES